MIEYIFYFNKTIYFDYVIGENVEILLEHSSKLVELFQYPWEALLLMYINLKYAGANPEEVVRRMVDGKVFFSQLYIYIFFMLIFPLYFYDLILLYIHKKIINI